MNSGSAPNLNQMMRDAEGHFGAGRHEEARRLLEELRRIAPPHPAIFHLLGLVLSRLGDEAEARRALERALALAPGDPQIANNLGNLLRRISEAEAALAAYDAAIAAAPRFAPARLHRAMILDELGRYEAARAELAAYEAIEPRNVTSLMTLASIERNSGNFRAAAERLDEILAIDATHNLARHARARIAVDLGEPDALAWFRRAVSAEPLNRDLLPGYVAAADTPELRRDAIERLTSATAADPTWYEGHAILSTALWEGGAQGVFTAHFEAAVALRPTDPALWKAYAEALAKADEFATAANICLRAEAMTRDPAFAAAAFSFLSASGDMEQAERLLARLPAGLPEPIALAKHRLRLRDPQAAEPLLAIETDLAPDNIAAWALRGIAWQMLGDRRFEWLNGQENLVSVDALPLSPADVSAIADWLRTLHASSTIRLDQSVRGGTQTLGNLFDRAEPEIARLHDAIRDAVERYRNALPPRDPAHPILKHRESPLGFGGSWSVRLTGGGFHVQHMHPQGIFSAASYWAVPAPSADDPQAGWLEIGGSPAYLALDLPCLRRIEPEAGRLVLFPSTLHHGTRPFPAGERITVAFDVTTGRG